MLKASEVPCRRRCIYLAARLGIGYDGVIFWKKSAGELGTLNDDGRRFEKFDENTHRVDRLASLEDFMESWLSFGIGMSSLTDSVSLIWVAEQLNIPAWRRFFCQ